jgi:hypothetical protein
MLPRSVVIRHMTEAFQSHDGFVAHFFYSQSNKSRLEAAHLFRSYVKQIIGFLDKERISCPQEITSSVKRLLVPIRYLPSFEEVIDEIFMPLSAFLSKHYPRTTYIVDGLDECELEEAQKVLKTFCKMISLPGRKVFISGRESLDVTSFTLYATTIHISDEDNREDIRKFIDWRTEGKMQERRLTETESVLQDIKNKLNEKADHMLVLNQ